MISEKGRAAICEKLRGKPCDCEPKVHTPYGYGTRACFVESTDIARAYEAERGLFTSITAAIKTLRSE